MKNVLLVLSLVESTVSVITVSGNSNFQEIIIENFVIRKFSLEKMQAKNLW